MGLASGAEAAPVGTFHRQEVVVGVEMGGHRVGFLAGHRGTSSSAAGGVQNGGEAVHHPFYPCAVACHEPFQGVVGDHTFPPWEALLAALDH